MRRAGRGYLIAGVATVVLAAGSVTAVAAAHGSGSGTQRAGMSGGRMATTNACTVPGLPGQVVTAVLGDMHGMTMMNGSATRRMMLHASPQRVSAGTVSLAVLNHGTKKHELVVMPLAAGATVGSRTVGADDAVSETGSLGEASNNCGAGSGEGINAGSAGWLTLQLAPGRYEILCNLPGHYAAGMYAELDVV